MAKLFEPLALREVTLRNRLAVSPMCQYQAEDGFVTTYHTVHYGKLALGGFGLVIVEATAVSPEARITHGDVGLWRDEQVEGLAGIAAFMKAQGAVPGIQLAHAGPKASMQRPYHGDGPLTEADIARGDLVPLAEQDRSRWRRDAIAEGVIDAPRIASSLADAQMPVSDTDLAGLLTESIEHATRLQAQQVAVEAQGRVQVADADHGVKITHYANS
mgnify:CR=1 FL=1